MMRRSMRLLTAATLATLVVAGSAPTSSAADEGAQAASRPCSDRSLRGEYGFTAQGVVTAASGLPAPLQGPFASAGLATFDGRGHFTLVATASFNGLVQPAATSGTYRVNPDCTYTSIADNGATFYSAVLDGGDEIAIIQTTPGVAISGRARRIEHGRGDEACDRRIAGRTYGFTATGAAGPPTVPAEAAGPLVGAGIVAFDRDGTFSLTARRSVAGLIDPEPLVLTGTYSVAADCTLDMAFDVGFTFTGAVVDGGRALVLVETDPGTALIVTAKRL
jgi:hypothetical protein